MNCMESKMALRVEIESLKGNSYDDAYAYFKAFLGEADDLEEWEGKIEYFNYDESKHEIVPALQYKGVRWGIDYILDYHYDGERKNGKSSYSMSEIAAMVKKISIMLNVSCDNIKLVSYEWYNGGDEPVEF